MKYFFLAIIIFIALPLSSLQVQLKEWSWGPELTRPYFLAEKKMIGTMYKSNTIDISMDTIWYSDTENILLFESRRGGRIHEYLGSGSWYPVIKKLNNPYYENFNSDVLNTICYYTKDPDVFLYELFPNSVDKKVFEDFYLIEKQGNHFSAHTITKEEFLEKKTEYVGKIGEKVPSEKEKYVTAIRINLDYGCYIMLEETKFLESDIVEIFIKNNKNETIFSFDNYHKTPNTANPFLYTKNNIAVNNKKNNIALLLSYFPKPDQDALVILNVIYDGIVNDSRVRLRSEPNLKSTTVKYLNKDDSVKILDRTTEKEKIDTMEAYWYKVKLANNNEGWVYGAFVNVE